MRVHANRFVALVTAGLLILAMSQVAIAGGPEEATTAGPAVAGKGKIEDSVIKAGHVPDRALFNAYGKYDYDSTDLYGHGADPEDGAPCMTKDNGFEPVDDGGLDTNGDGTTDQNDAFDGGLFTEINGDLFAAPKGATKSSMVKGSGTVDGFRVTRIERGLKAYPVLRSYIAITNPSDSSRVAIVTVDSAMGADNSENTRDSSNHNARFDPSDRWFVASDSASSPSDPPILFVLSGVGAPGISSIVWAPEDDSSNKCEGAVVYRYRVPIPAHSTRALLMFTELRDTNEHASKAAKKYNARVPSNKLIGGLGPTAKSRIVNWDL